MKLAHAHAHPRRIELLDQSKRQLLGKRLEEATAGHLDLRTDETMDLLVVHRVVENIRAARRHRRVGQLDVGFDPLTQVPLLLGHPEMAVSLDARKAQPVEGLAGRGLGGPSGRLWTARHGAPSKARVIPASGVLGGGYPPRR